MAGRCEEMLINLNSPEKVNNTPYQKTYLKNPLIPGPDVNCNVENNNPFDVVAVKAENWDPFELVLHESLKKVENAQNMVNNGPSTIENNCNDTFKENCIKEDNIISYEDPCVNTRTIFRSQSVTENVKFFRSPSKVSHKSDSESPPFLVEDSPQLSTSITDKIKKVVKKRVSKCIERALNSSLSQPDLTKSETYSPMKSLNNTLSRIAGVKSELMANLNKNVNVENSCYQYKRIPNANCVRLSRSFSAADYKKEDLRDVLEEAKNISMTLQNMSLTSKKTISPEYKPKNNLRAEEDLLSVKPPWEENGDCSLSSESDDCSIGLPKVKLFYLKKKEKQKSEISVEKLEHYKRRIRASLDGNMSCDEESPTNNPVKDVKSDETSNTAFSESSAEEKKNLQEKETPDILSVNIPVISEVNNLRPKKRGNFLKKGPLKAIVPLQKMTKSIADKLSPMRKNSYSTVISSKATQDGSFSSSIIYPVAASTPNNKGTLNRKTDSPSASKTKSRLSRRDTEPDVKGKINSFRRSVSLSSESRATNIKLPFSSVNANVKQRTGAYSNRPHTAPTKTNSSFGKSSPKTKEPFSIPRRNMNQLAVNDKENRLQAY